MYKRYLALFMSLLLAVSLLIPTGQVEASDHSEKTNVTMTTTSDVQQALKKAVDHMLRQEINSEWQAIGLVKAGAVVPVGYEGEFYKKIESEILGKTGKGRLKITDVERLAMAAVAIGKDPTNINGFNLIDKIYNSENWTFENSDSMTYQGNNGLIFALIALDTKNYSVPASARWNRESIVAELVKNQLEDGSWSLSIDPPGKTSYDITSMALIGLAPYTNQPAVKTAVDRAISFLSEHQGPTGGFNEEFVGGITSEATSQVIIGLTANDIDPQGQQFTKNGINLIDHLLSFQTENGGFKHTAGESGSNGMATDQALQGLVAYDLYTKGEGRLYDFNKMNPEPQPELEIAAPSSLKGILNDSLLNIQKNKNGVWSSIFVEKSEMKEGYYIVQAGETGNQSTATIPSGTKKVFLVDNDRSYRDFDAEIVDPNKSWTITFNQTVKNTTTNLEKIYVEDVQGNNIPVNVTATGKTVTVTPITNYTSGQLYSLFIVEPVSEDDITLKQATRKLFIIK